MSINAVIFDLDGVIVSTDEFHYQGWQKMSDDEGIAFDRHTNERLRGVSRMESLEIILEKSKKQYSESEKIALAERKNGYYKDLLKSITPKDILPGVTVILNGLRAKGIKMAIGSSSKNTPAILKYIGLDTFFDAIADGNGIKNSKPHPEVFLLAATLVGVLPKQCLVVEDAIAGVSAGLAGGMKVLAVGSAATDERAHLKAVDMTRVTVEELLAL